MPKSVADKLLIKPQSAVWLSAREHRPLVEPLPDGAAHVDAPDRARVVIIFAADGASLRASLDQHRAELWPILSDVGLRPISQVAIDDVWSALRFRMLKDGEAPFTGGKT